jgi:signal transduction histidine kinase
MKMREDPYSRLPDRFVARIACLSFFFGCMIAGPGWAQTKHMVQVKAFDQDLQPYKSIEISVNSKEFFPVNTKGTAFIELTDNDLPIKTVKVRNETLEAASWNYSKGILEVIIRQKNYRLTHWVVKDAANIPIANLKVTFRGKQLIAVTTDTEGRIQIPVSLDEEIKSAGQFEVAGYEVERFQLSDKENVLVVARPAPAPDAATTLAKQDTEKEKDYFRDFDLSKLDSIQSLTVFYAIFKNYEMKRLSDEAKRKLDAKFNQLVTQLQDSAARSQSIFIGRISDSSFVKDDISNLLTQASEESKMLALQRSEFDEKIELISEKIASNISRLNPEERNKLLSDIALLEGLLIDNESRFYKNHQDYRQLINSLKDRFFNVEDLETKLSASEERRLEEQRIFRQRLLAVLSVVVVFGILIVLLIYLARKLKKQKKELVRVNDEINHINENLESLVAERTKLLMEAHKELDTFLYRASHDLRGPVCSIIGLCNLAGHLPEQDSKAIIEKVVHTTHGMDRLLKKLSMISEINEPTNFSKIAIAERVAKLESEFHSFMRVSKVDLNINCPSDIVIDSYPVLIDSILENILENALFYASLRKTGNRRVDFNAVIIGDILELSIYDNGIGFDQKIQSKLFNMFFKGDVNSKGNGLGLYIVQKSLQALHGDIMIESRHGEFTKVIVHLPLTVEDHQSLQLKASDRRELLLAQ